MPLGLRFCLGVYMRNIKGGWIGLLVGFLLMLILAWSLMLRRFN